MELDWSKIYSDHQPVICYFEPRQAALTWNIMTKCRDVQHGINNGFNKQEIDEIKNFEQGEYYQRLMRVAEKTSELVKQNPYLAIVGLQEVPDHTLIKLLFMNKLSKKLGDHWFIDNYLYNNIFAYTKNSYTPGTFGNLVIYNKNFFKSAENVSDRHNISSEQSHRYQLIKLVDTTPEAKVMYYANVHFHYHNNDKIEAVKNLLSVPENGEMIIIAGDFNSNVEKLSHNKAISHQIAGAYYKEGGSITWNSHLGSQNAPISIDGFLSNVPFAYTDSDFL